MKKKSLKILSLFLVSGVLLSGCTLSKMIKMAQQQQLTVQPSPIETHADKVNFEVSALLPVKMLKKNHIYSVNVYYVSGDQKKNLGDIQFKYEDFSNNPSQQPKISKNFTMDYEDALKNGKVMILGTAAKVTGKSKATPEMEIAKGIITTSKLVRTQNYVAYADHGYNTGEELIPSNVDFYFEKGSSKLRTTELKGDNGSKMNAFIATKNRTRTVKIVGSHSPEGSETINGKLAEERAAAIEKYYREQMVKFDYKELADSIKFVLVPVVQDWTEFKNVINASNSLTSAQKSEIMKTISQGSDFVEQEKQLKKLDSYKILTTEIYPPLRTAKTEILYVKPKKTKAQIALLADKIIKNEVKNDTLNAEELGYAATITPVLEERELMYKKLVEKTDAWQAHNNLGAVYIEMAKKATGNQKDELIEKAITHLNIAVKKEEAAQVYNNLCAANSLKGNYMSAYENGQKAMNKNPNQEMTAGLKSNLGAEEIRHAKYDDAIKNLSTGSDDAITKFNLALAQLLTKDFSTAKSTFEKATAQDDKDALSYYGAAISSARLGDEKGVIDNLTKACGLDGSLKGKAMEDLEFLTYFENPAFISALK